jgi:hypothetical protein
MVVLGGVGAVSYERSLPGPSRVDGSLRRVARSLAARRTSCRPVVLCCSCLTLKASFQASTTLETTHGRIDFLKVNSNSNATSRRWQLWEIDLRFAPGLPPGTLARRPPHLLLWCVSFVDAV